MNNKSVSTATIGFMCLALSFWMVNMPSAGWYGGGLGAASVGGMFYPLAVLLAIMGILAFVHARTLDSIIFFGGAGLLWTAYSYVHMMTMPHAAALPESYNGWWFFVWTVFFAWVFVGALKAGVVRALFLLGTWLSLLAGAIAGWSGGSHVFTLISGYIGLATAILAAIVSASEVICHGLAGRPNEDGRTTVAPRSAAGGGVT
jgi:uncharacterized protein